MEYYRVQYGRRKEEVLSEDELRTRFQNNICMALISSDLVLRTVVDQEGRKVIITKVVGR